MFVLRLTTGSCGVSFILTSKIATHNLECARYSPTTLHRSFLLIRYDNSSFSMPSTNIGVFS